jgi:hypothetical protein
LDIVVVAVNAVDVLEVALPTSPPPPLGQSLGKKAAPMFSAREPNTAKSYPVNTAYTWPTPHSRERRGDGRRTGVDRYITGQRVDDW